MNKKKKLTDDEWAERKALSYERRKARHRVWYQRNRAHSKEKATASALKCRYGISLEDYKLRLEVQEHTCAICGTDNPGGRAKRFCVDHNHETGEFRGLLCHSCNRALGLFKDSPTILSAALEYLTDNGHYGPKETPAASEALS